MKRHSAFTLIELLIVITIMGILAAAIVLNFGGARERQQLSILADKSVAMLQVAQSDVRSGKYDSDAGTYYCEGAYIASGAEPEFVTMTYDTSSGACDFSTMTTEDYGLKTDPAVVGTITVGGTTVSELYALYLPPDATMHFLDSAGNEYSGDGLVTFTSGGGGEAYSIALKLSVLTGVSSLTLTE